MARRLDAFVAECTREFPAEQRMPDGESLGYWHAHVPLPTAAVTGPHGSRALRRKVVQSLFAIATWLMREKPRSASQTRVVVLLDLPNLADSQVVVFFSQAYFDAFWTRTSAEQTWTPLNDTRSFSREWREPLPPRCVERGYREVIREDGMVSTSELWAIGELDDARDA